MSLTQPELRKMLDRLDNAHAQKTIRFPVPETKETNEALRKLANFSRRQKRELLRRKVPEALRTWALKKMGRDIGRYLDEALSFYFFEVLVCKLINENCNVQQVIEETPLTFPLKLRKSPVVSFDIFEVWSDYKQILPTIQTILRNTRRRPAERKLQLVRLGINKYRIGKYLQGNWRASLIALDFVGRKHALPMSAEALKKYIRFMKNPAKFSARIREDFERRSSL